MKDYCGAPLYGIKTGCNEAFLIDSATKEKLLREDPRSAEIIKPYLRGQDIGRWVPQWAGLWMIFSRRGIPIESYPAVYRYLQAYQERLQPKPLDWSGDKWPGRKVGTYLWYELQDAVDYWRKFEEPKICIQMIAFHSRIAFDGSGMYLNNSAVIVPTSDKWVNVVLNSSVLWWVQFRLFPHKKDEALAMDIPYVSDLPIPKIPHGVEGEVEELWWSVQASISKGYSLSSEFAGQLGEMFSLSDSECHKATSWMTLSSEIVLSRLKKHSAVLKHSAVATNQLIELHEQLRSQQLELLSRQLEIERRLGTLVEDAYGLTPEERALLRATRPIRDPLDVLEAKIRGGEVVEEPTLGE